MRKLFFHIAAMIVLLATSCSETVGNFDDGNPLRKSPVYVNVDPNINLGGLEFSFVEIPEGCFMMGSSENEYDRHTDELQHNVMLDGFYLGKYEITQAQWKYVMGNNPSYFKGDYLPVENVTWVEVQNFISRLNKLTGKEYRLPTEAEWEYACRAGTKAPFYTGKNLLTADANYNGEHPYKDFAKGEYKGKTVKVGSYEPNPWGLYDMYGNVWEWCSDWYVRNYDVNDNVNPQGPKTGTKRVFRGGSWISRGRYCRSANRFYENSCYRYYNLGFRLAMSMKRQTIE